MAYAYTYVEVGFYTGVCLLVILGSRAVVLRLLSLVREDLFACFVIAAFITILYIVRVLLIFEVVDLVNVFVFAGTDVSKGRNLLLLRCLFYSNVVLYRICEITLLARLCNAEQLRELLEVRDCNIVVGRQQGNLVPKVYNYLLVVLSLTLPKLGTYTNSKVNKDSPYKLLAKLRAALKVNVVLYKIEDLEVISAIKHIAQLPSEGLVRDLYKR